MSDWLLCRTPLSKILVRAVRKSSFSAFRIKEFLSTWSVPGNTDVIPPIKWNRDSNRPFKIDQPPSNKTPSLHVVSASRKSGLAAAARTRSWCSCSISSISGRPHPANNKSSSWVQTMQHNYECGKINNWWGNTGGSDSLIYFAPFLSATTRITTLALPM